MTSQPGKQTVAKHNLPNISRTKGKQRLKFGQLKKCRTRNIFLGKLYTKCGGENIARSFPKKSKCLFLLNVKLRAMEIIEIKLQTIYFYKKHFYKTKRGA